MKMKTNEPIPDWLAWLVVVGFLIPFVAFIVFGALPIAQAAIKLETHTQSCQIWWPENNTVGISIVRGFDGPPPWSGATVVEVDPLAHVYDPDAELIYYDDTLSLEDPEQTLVTLPHAVVVEYGQYDQRRDVWFVSSEICTLESLPGVTKDVDINAVGFTPGVDMDVTYDERRSGGTLAWIVLYSLTAFVAGLAVVIIILTSYQFYLSFRLGNGNWSIDRED